MRNRYRICDECIIENNATNLTLENSVTEALFTIRVRKYLIENKNPTSIVNKSFMTCDACGEHSGYRFVKSYQHTWGGVSGPTGRPKSS